MPTNLDYELYFNIVFFSVIGLGFIIGYLRGLKKTLYAFIVSVLFYGFFFITIDLVVNQLWEIPIPFAFENLVSVMPELTGVSTIGDAVFVLIESNLPGDMTATLQNTEVISLVTGLGQFVLKIVYTLIYFTVFNLIFRFIFWFIKVFVFDNFSTKLTKKDKKQIKKERKKSKKEAKKLRVQLVKKNKKKKKPLYGALIGAAKGAVAAYVTLIIMGGFMSISDSFLNLLPDTTDQTAFVEETMLLSNSPVPVPLADGESDPLIPIPEALESQIEEARKLSDAFHENIFVSNATQLTIEDAAYGEPVALNLYLFDSVFSFNFSDEKILLRDELTIIADTGSILLESDYFDTQDLSDLEGEDIALLFSTLAESELITSMIPLGIEVGSEYLDVPVEIPIDDLYAIDWQAELSSLGAIASVGFDLVNNAGILEDEADLTTVTLDGAEVRSLFDSLADSELATLGAYVALEPLLREAGADMQAIITVPDGLDWATEFEAFGAVAETVLNTGVTVGELEGGDPNVLIGALSTMDFTVLLQSDIVSHALKNILSGDAGIDGLDMIVVPDDVVWFDVTDNDGNITTEGELRNILQAVNAIGDVASDFSFDNIDLNMISEFDDPTIDTLFDSEILVATISNFVLTMDLGTTPLVIPDTVLDAEGYMTSLELKAIAKAAKVLVEDLACDEGDTVCEDTGFDIAKAFNLSDTSIDTLLTSDILGATIGNLIIDQGGDILTVPSSALTTVSVDSVNQDVVSNDEIKKLFQAVSVLGFTDLENMSFDPTIIQSLGLEADPTTLDTAKSDKLFGSKLVHATLSEMLFEQTTGVDSSLDVPHFSVEGTAVRIFDATDNIEYLSTDELEDILQALITLDIADFSEVDALDLNLIIANSNTLLESSILHATISKQVFDLGPETVAVPYKDVDGVDIRVEVGDEGQLTDTEYIIKDEIINVLDSLEILGVTDIGSFSGTVDIASITSDPSNITTMLESAILHATISDQLLDLDTDGSIDVPYLAEDDLTLIRVTVGDVGEETEYISKTEIDAMIDAMNVLGFTDVEGFTGSVDLSTFTEGDNASTILASSTIQATVSKQVLDLTTDPGLSATFVVPYYEDDDSTTVRVVVGEVLDSTDTEYIKKAELEAMIDGLDILGITDVTTFDGNIDLTNFYNETNRNTLLTSSIMQATISQQLLDLGSGTLNVPANDVDDVAVRVIVGSGLEETEYVTNDEIGAMFESLEILGITDIATFDGTIDLTVLSTSLAQDTLLDSASIHATITDTLLDLNDDVLIVPMYNQNGETNGNEVRVTVSTIEYVVKDEIKALIDAFNEMGYSDLDSFGASINSSQFFSGRATLLASSSIQATVSNKMLNSGGDALLVPDTNIDTLETIRIIQTDVTYIEVDEMDAIFASLEELGLTDFTSLDFSPGSIFGKDYNIIMGSATVQATISSYILPNTVETAAAGTTTLIVPAYFKEAIAVQTVGNTQIEKVELIALLNSLDTLGISDFGDSMSGSTISTMNDSDLNTLLGSGSIHTTIDNMLRGNASISSSIPEAAEEDALYKADITTKVELIKFIKATQTATGGTGDFTTVTFDAATLAGLSAGEQDVVADSMIVRNILTPTVVAADLAANLPSGTVVNGDYYNSDPATFLNKAKLLEIINAISW